MTSIVQRRADVPEPGRTPASGPDVVASVPAATVRLRNAFTLTSRSSADGHEHHLVTAPRRGPERRQARHAILAVLHRAEKRRQRVWFAITFGDYSRLPLGFSGGYEPGSVLTQCHARQDDPYAWFQEQFQRHHQPVEANAMIGVEIATWPSSTSVALAAHAARR